jgi:hypothetical protein
MLAANHIMMAQSVNISNNLALKKNMDFNII